MVEVRVAQKNVEMARARLNDVMKDRKHMRNSGNMHLKIFCMN